MDHSIYILAHNTHIHTHIFLEHQPHNKQRDLII